MRSLGKLVVKSTGLQRQQKSCFKNQIHIYLSSDSTFERQEYQRFNVILRLFTEFEVRGQLRIYEVLSLKKKEGREE